MKLRIILVQNRRIMANWCNLYGFYNCLSETRNIEQNIQARRNTIMHILFLSIGWLGLKQPRSRKRRMNAGWGPKVWKVGTSVRPLTSEILLKERLRTLCHGFWPRTSGDSPSSFSFDFSVVYFKIQGLPYVSYCACHCPVRRLNVCQFAAASQVRRPVVSRWMSRSPKWKHLGACKEYDCGGWNITRSFLWRPQKV